MLQKELILHKSSYEDKQDDVLGEAVNLNSGDI